MLVLLVPTASLAAPGDLDRHFGGFGTDGFLHQTRIRPLGSAVDHEGRLVLVGDDGSRFGHFLIERRSEPRFLTEEFLEPVLNAEASAVAITPDDKIVVAGHVAPPRSLSENDFVVARLNPDFTLDTTFAGTEAVPTGVIQTDLAGNEDFALAVAVRQDGRIVAAGWTRSGEDTEWAVVRYNPDGTLDRSFSGTGKRTIDFGDSLACARAVAIQDDDKIVIAGVTEPDIIDNWDFALARLNPDGSLDDSFGDGGKVTTGFGGIEGGYAMALAPDGKIIVAGGRSPDNLENIKLARYLPNGRLDGDFGMGGKVVTSLGAIRSPPASPSDPTAR